MPKLSEKTKLRREVARQVAEQMAAEGDRSILDAAEEIAEKIKWVSVDGALEVIMCAALHEMKGNGKAREVERVEKALNRLDWEASHD